MECRRRGRYSMAVITPETHGGHPGNAVGTATDRFFVPNLCHPDRSNPRIVLRSYQRTTETMSHTRVAPASTSQAGWRARNCHTIIAKTANPTLPIVAPRASRHAAFRPRIAPSMPARCFFSFSWFSTSVALAGKIAGNAKNNPPIPGPNVFAIIPVVTVMRPPKMKRTIYSCHFVCLKAAKQTFTLIVSPI